MSGGRGRNNKLYDLWSLVHLATGIVFGWIMPPAVAIAAMVLWEPLEILVLSPLLGRYGILFGRETLRNSLSDIAFDLAGISLGFYVLLTLAKPPFTLF